MQVPELIDHVMKITGSAAELARRLDVSFQRISDYKHGRTPCPPDIRARLAAMAGEDPLEALIEAVTERAGPERREGLRAALKARAGAMVKY